MKTQDTITKTVLFKDDLRHFLLNWKDTDENKNDWWKQEITDKQKQLWPTSKKLSQDLLGKKNNRTNIPLTIVHPIGGDIEEVGSCGVSQAKKYFEDNENMRWPADSDVVRMGVFFHWGYYRTVNMILKTHWEKYLVEKAYGVMKYEQCEGLSDFLRNSTKAIQQFSLTFFEDVCTREMQKSWFDTLKYYDFEEFDFEKYSLLLQEYCNNQFFLNSLNDSVWMQFTEEKQREKEYATEEYWQYKTIWAAREGELEQVIYQYGQAKLNYRYLTNKWYKHFGDDYIKARELLMNNQILQNRILLKNENPDITPEQMQEEEHNNFASLKRDYKETCELSATCKNFEESEKGQVSIETVNNYHQACKKLLKRIWRLTHPDSFQLKGFTDKQVNVLFEKFENSLEINERIAIHGSHEFDLLELYNILAEVENIWNTIGKEIPAYDEVLGETTQDKVEWLKNRVQFLEKQIEQMHLRVKAVETNVDYIEKKESLANDVNIEQTKRALKEKIKMLAELNTQLVNQCKKLGINSDIEV